MVHSYRKGEGMVEAEFPVGECELHEDTCALCCRTAAGREGAFRMGMLTFWGEI